VISFDQLITKKLAKFAKQKAVAHGKDCNKTLFTIAELRGVPALRQRRLAARGKATGRRWFGYECCGVGN
jgi:hypothetical protein